MQQQDNNHDKEPIPFPIDRAWKAFRQKNFDIPETEQDNYELLLQALETLTRRQAELEATVRILIARVEKLEAIVNSQNNNQLIRQFRIIE